MSSVQLISGANAESADVAGKTLAEVRQAYQDVLNIDPRAEVRLGGKPVGPDYVLQEGDQVEFIKVAGAKG
ncbi:MAG: thiamine biosynthesis protein ThiS [Candidatus Vogelbacteria bacterium]|nr:thiamine biosynthesis protein ThiS [Candidatus Vogelbacteria bacterium]